MGQDIPHLACWKSARKGGWLQTESCKWTVQLSHDVWSDTGRVTIEGVPPPVSVPVNMAAKKAQKGSIHLFHKSITHGVVWGGT